MSDPRPRRAVSRARFQPRFALTLVYLGAFFLGYCLLLIAPELIEVARTVAPGPEQQEQARRVAYATVRPRLPIALAAALVTTALLAYAKRLPGMRPD